MYTIHSDCGSNFEIHVIKDLCQAFDIRKTRTTPYHPRSDGLVERLFKTTKEMLRSMLSPNSGNWADILPTIEI